MRRRRLDGNGVDTLARRRGVVGRPRDGSGFTGATVPMDPSLRQTANRLVV